LLYMYMHRNIIAIFLILQCTCIILC